MVRKTHSKPETIKIRIKRDGVFIAADVRRETGAEETLPTADAEALIKKGLADAF